MEIDTLKEALLGQERANEDLIAELDAVKEVADHKQMNTERLKTELRTTFESNSRLKEDNISLENQLRWHKDERRALADRMDGIQKSLGKLSPHLTQ